jgi:hypothetical protein
MNPTNFPQNMARKRKEAGERKIEHDLMSPDAKLRKLDRAPGESKKERAKILKAITKQAGLKVGILDVIVSGKNVGRSLLAESMEQAKK